MGFSSLSKTALSARGERSQRTKLSQATQLKFSCLPSFQQCRGVPSRILTPDLSWKRQLWVGGPGVQPESWGMGPERPRPRSLQTWRPTEEILSLEPSVLEGLGCESHITSPKTGKECDWAVTPGTETRTQSCPINVCGTEHVDGNWSLWVRLWGEWPPGTRRKIKALWRMSLWLEGPRNPRWPGPLPCAHMAPLHPSTLRTPFLLLSKPELGEHWPSRWSPRWRSLSWTQAWAAPRPHLPPQSLRCCCRPRWVPTLHCPASCILTPPHSRPYHQGSLPKSRMHISFGNPSLMTPVLETAS